MGSFDDQCLVTGVHLMDDERALAREFSSELTLSHVPPLSENPIYECIIKSSIIGSFTFGIGQVFRGIRGGPVEARNGLVDRLEACRF